jgi:hypothetical protein
MTYTTILSLINDAYADFSAKYVVEKTLGADTTYNNRQLFFVKCTYKVLLNQDGDENIDALTKENIQDCIVMFNKYCNATVPIEWS